MLFAHDALSCKHRSVHIRLSVHYSSARYSFASFLAIACTYFEGAPHEAQFLIYCCTYATKCRSNKICPHTWVKCERTSTNLARWCLAAQTRAFAMTHRRLRRRRWRSPTLWSHVWHTSATATGKKRRYTISHTLCIEWLMSATIRCYERDK